MPYSVWQAFITDGGEAIVSAASVAVYRESDGALADIFDGPAGVAIANPTTSAIDGLVRFYAAAGTYRIDVTKGGVTKSFRNIPIGEAAGRDVGVAGGVAPLDEVNQVPAEHLTNYYTQAEMDAALALKLDAADYAQYYVGTYASLAALQAAHPAGSDGQYALVDAGADAFPRQYVWDVQAADWVAGSDAAPGTTDALAEGGTNLYFTAQRVRDVVLTGLSLVTNTAITAADTVLAAFGKLQAQITGIDTRVTALEAGGGGIVRDWDLTPVVTPGTLVKTAIPPQLPYANTGTVAGDTGSLSIAAGAFGVGYFKFGTLPAVAEDGIYYWFFSPQAIVGNAALGVVAVGIGLNAFGNAFKLAVQYEAGSGLSLTTDDGITPNAYPDPAFLPGQWVRLSYDPATGNVGVLTENGVDVPDAMVLPAIAGLDINLAIELQSSEACSASLRVTTDTAVSGLPALAGATPIQTLSSPGLPADAVRGDILQVIASGTHMGVTYDISDGVPRGAVVLNAETGLVMPIDFLDPANLSTYQPSNVVSTTVTIGPGADYETVTAFRNDVITKGMHGSQLTIYLNKEACTADDTVWLFPEFIFVQVISGDAITAGTVTCTFPDNALLFAHAVNQSGTLDVNGKFDCGSFQGKGIILDWNGSDGSEIRAGSITIEGFNSSATSNRLVIKPGGGIVHINGYGKGNNSASVTLVHESEGNRDQIAGFCNGYVYTDSALETIAAHGRLEVTCNRNAAPVTPLSPFVQTMQGSFLRLSVDCGAVAGCVDTALTNGGGVITMPTPPTGQYTAAYGGGGYANSYTIAGIVIDGTV